MTGSDESRGPAGREASTAFPLLNMRSASIIPRFPMSADNFNIQVNRKALELNLDQRVYGTFAEIGAGQEVARRFFFVGAAAGTVAKTMSAYDMTFSDAIYGTVERYVSRQRLWGMLDHEFTLLRERLDAKRR